MLLSYDFKFWLKGKRALSERKMEGTSWRDAEGASKIPSKKGQK